MNRYLLHISYLGTQFRGAQKQIIKSKPDVPDRLSVQGVLDIACRKLKPKNKPIVIVSSRTDTGVHALHSTCHVDLQSPTGEPYNIEYILLILNSYFFKSGIDVRVLNAQVVSDRFHARYDAIRRSYIYRIAIPKIKNKTSQALINIPIEELKSCYFLRDPNFDINTVKEVASYFIGRYDYRTFMKTPSTEKPGIVTRRKIEQFDVIPGKPLYFQEPSYYPSYSLYNSVQFEYINFVISARSFLYRQIRRTVGVLIAVGQGKISPREVKFMIQIPSKESWNPHAVTAPPYALFLSKVEYNPNDLR